ncbi:MAG: L-2-hydroxyglutarate oxidase [Sulfurovum sp.]|nr:L-2-hydroxyglutarate oxidase [Sulfurovum sp.]
MVDYLIVGAGIIGLNIAIALKKKYPNAKITIIDKESSVAMHSSGRNSGVLHAGFYYTVDSLKAKFTGEGNHRMKEFCQERGLQVNKCAKVVVATNQEELDGLEELKRRGDANSVPLEWMTQKELEEMYPYIKTYQKALFSPNTATIDPKEVTEEFAIVAQEMGIVLRLDTTYEYRVGKSRVGTSAGMIEYKKLINCAGLYADKIAKDFDLAENFVIIPFKGVYLKDSGNKSRLATNIYPVPNLVNPFLGVHYTLTVDSDAKIGPTAIPALWRENYKGFTNFDLDEMLQILYYEAKLFITNAFGFRSLAISEVKKYTQSHLIRLAKKLTSKMDHDGFDQWSTPGIRAQLLDTDTLELVQDFVVEVEEESVHILNAVSPAFTSSIPFSEWVVKKCL